MKQKIENSMILTLPAISENERLARQLLTAFVAPLDPTVEELADFRTAVSEAVTNSILHGYRNDAGKPLLYISAKRTAGRKVTVKIRDKGCGMEDVEKCRTPLFTTDESGERGGMGFAIMESFTDRMKVVSKPGKGCCVTLVKIFTE